MNRDNSLITKLFSCCHTVKEIKGEILGDEIDKEMYLSSEFKMQVVKNPHIKFITEGKNDEIIEVLRINQF